ncbi:hypothetical protein TNCV_1070881 [Trichonephila clavipes]|nr:hypothetical protein TNCV_1070881 [Trichonephila clavipes]
MEREVGGSSPPQGVLPLNWGETELNRSVTCMVLKATDNDMRHFAMMNFVGLDLAFADQKIPISSRSHYHPSDLHFSSLCSLVSSLCSLSSSGLFSAKKDPFKHQGWVHNMPLVTYHWQATKVCLRPSASLESYSYGTHNHTLWPVWNVLMPDFSFDIWTFCSSHCLCSLEPFSNHLPR